MATKKPAKKKKNPERVRIGKLSRRKGAAYELVIAKVMAEVFSGARRGIGQARSGGDIPDVEGCAHFWVQTKHEKSPSLFAALKQAENELCMRRLQSHAPCNYSSPMVVARRSGENTDVVLLKLKDFVTMRKVINQQAALLTEEQVTIAQLTQELDLARSGALPPGLEAREALEKAIKAGTPTDLGLKP